jgi:L-aspartate oxidase
MILDLHQLYGRPIVIGGGIAGLMTALHLAPEPVLLLSKVPIGKEASSPLAQGGLAAALGNDDNPALHLADTLAAGDGLCDPEIAGCVVDAAPHAIEVLAKLGVRFDRTPNGAHCFGQEAAHCRRRIVHAQGDRTGEEIMRALAAAVRVAPSITVVEGLEARRLIVEHDAVTGVLAAGPSGQVVLGTDRVVIATGGIGGLFLETTNPATCFGHGLALAARAGADLADLEFVQFHPTAFAGSYRPMPLISEAVRGEGAVLVDETGRRFLADQPGAELATRDVVARAVWHHLSNGHRVFLDARENLDFAARFPGIASFCHGVGLDPATQLIPIRPAAHYHMGGIAVDGAGRSSVEGLWACGEAACTGLHGANRLASNSLTEAAVCAAWVAHSVGGTLTKRRWVRTASALPPAPNPSPVRPILSRGVGVLRDREGLSSTIAELFPLTSSHSAASDPAAVALMITIAALRREESRGAHHRTDFPERTAVARRSILRLGEALAAAADIASSAPMARRAWG